MTPRDDPSPWWLKVVLQIGPTAAIALFLVWFTTHIIDAKLDRIVVSSSAAHDGMQRAERSMSSFADEQRRFNEAQLGALQQICLNGARDAKAVALCRGLRPEGDAR